MNSSGSGAGRVVRPIYDFSRHHTGDVYLSHRWQKHVHETRKGSLLVPVHHLPPGADTGVTHMYRAPSLNREFTLEQTLAGTDIGYKGDLNAGIIAEDSQGRL